MLDRCLGSDDRSQDCRVMKREGGWEVQRGVDVKSRACNPSLSASRLPTSIDTEKDGIGLALEHVRVSLVKSVV